MSAITVVKRCRGAHVLGSLAALALSCLASNARAAEPNARAEEPDAQIEANVERLAVGVCGTCHGTTGNSEQPKFPRLAGQNANYLAAQLKAFRGQTRGDPDAIGYMWGMAGPLDDATIEGLAKYYSAQQPSSGHSADPALVARGKQIFEQGIP